MKALEYLCRLVVASFWLFAAIVALPFAGLDILVDFFATEADTWGR